MEEIHWYFIDEKNNDTPVGPFLFKDMQSKYRNKVINENTYCWHEEISDWQTLDHLYYKDWLVMDLFRTAASAPPPPPPPMPIITDKIQSSPPKKSEIKDELTEAINSRKLKLADPNDSKREKQNLPVIKITKEENKIDSENLKSNTSNQGEMLKDNEQTKRDKIKPEFVSKPPTSQKKFEDELKERVKKQLDKKRNTSSQDEILKDNEETKTDKIKPVFVSKPPTSQKNFEDELKERLKKQFAKFT